MTRVIAWFCLLVLLASLGVHLATYDLLVPLPMEEGAGFLHLAVMAACFLALVVGLLAVRRVRRQKGCTKKEAQQAVFEFIPALAKALAVAVFLYAWCVVMWSIFWVEHGSPRRTAEEGFELTSHGHFIRSLSEEEFWRLQAYNVRAFSALWTSFSLCATVFVWSLPRRRSVGIQSRA
jgi:hypothetical protein